MIYRIRHRVRCYLAAPAERIALNLYLRPRALPGQRVHGCTLRTSAETARLTDGTDHFGNPVTRLFLDHAAGMLEIVAESTVELAAGPELPRPDLTPAWERVAAAAQREPEIAELTFPSPATIADPVVRRWAEASFPPGRPILAGLRALAERIGAREDAMHCMLAGLRSRLLPVRYVCGYRRLPASPGLARLPGADRLHAWIACWLGPEWGWVELDPAGFMPVQQDHVRLGWGREPADVSPARGVLLGGGAHRLSVSIDMQASPASAASDGLPAASTAR